MTVETLGEIRAKYNFWNEKERPYYEALSEAIRVLNAQKDKSHYAKIVRCKECIHFTQGGWCDRGFDWFPIDENDFCSMAEKMEVQE